MRAVCTLRASLDSRKLYPFDADDVKREEYVDFAHMMEDYLWPRFTGINKLSIYINGYVKYLRDTGEYRVDVSEFSGDHTCEEAAER